jgi:hypothetical protein
LSGSAGRPTYDEAMLARSRMTRAAILSLLLGLLLTAFVATPPPVDAAGSTGVAYGTIKFPQRDKPGMRVLWFTKDWTYLGAKTAAGGTYSLNLQPGSYHLQFVDQRPTYKTEKYAPTDIAVTVDAGTGTRKNVTMKRGAFITGTVKTHGKNAKQARVVAANQSETSFQTTANDKGQFAIGGLPEGKYSVFTYDHRNAYVGKSTYAGKLTPGKSANLQINLTTRAGSLRVNMFTSANGVKKQVSGNPVVTAVSTATGQFWSEKVKSGSVVFQGLYPGKYTLVANGYGVWFGKTGAVSGPAVKAGKPQFGSFTYTKRGGWVSGDLVDGGNPDYPLKKPFPSAPGAKIDLYSSGGALLASGYANDNGHFTVQGQISTISDATLVVTPGVDSAGYMNGEGYCQFDEATVESVSITIGQGSDAGTVFVPRYPGQTSPACASE